MKTKPQLSSIGSNNGGGGHHVVNSPNGAGSLSNSPVNVSFGVSRAAISHVEQPILALNEQQYMSQTGEVDDGSNNTTILTRSAAVRAAQQMKLHQQHRQAHNGANSRPRNTVLGSSALSGHGQHQHVVGKIVKPIPVRPISSSSSTHSSSFSASSCINLIKNTNNNNSAESVVVNQQPPTAHTLSSCEQMPNFSLIAKYFASFPATRLKTSTNVEPGCGGAGAGGVGQPAFIPSSSQSPLSFTTSSFAAPANHKATTNEHQLFKMTPFLPFKKSHFGKHQPTQLQQYHINVAPNVAVSQQPVQAQAHVQIQAQAQSIGHLPVGAKPHSIAIQPIGQANHLNVNGELKPIDIGVMTRHSYQNQNTNANYAAKFGMSNVVGSNGGQLGGQMAGSTMYHNNHNHNHNHHQSLSNTDHLCTNFKRLIKLNDQTDAGDVVYAHVHSPASPHTATSNTPTLDEPSSSCEAVSGTCDTTSASGAASDQPRFGQITMETRSTRKFLIKHHPYLQLNNTHSNATMGTSATTNRPSINLIKMKKLNKKQTVIDCCSPRRKTIVSRSGCEGTDRLLKFTDLAPSPTANGKQTRQPKLQAKLTSSSSSSCKSNRLRSAARNRHNSQMENDHFVAPTTATGEFVFYNLGLQPEQYEDTRLDDDMDDSKEEESSGYYSSYHSVDLISSSGGSSGGDLNRQSKLATQVLGNKYQPTASASAVITTVNPHHSHAPHHQHSPQASTASTDAQSIKLANQPHHHYHTRYLSNILLQTTNQTTTTTAPNNHKPSTPANNNNNKSINTPPCTRLRYQQLLAAAAHNNAASNDLDLDQIEND